MSNLTNEELALAYQQGDRAALAELWTQVERLAHQMVRPYVGLAHKNRAADADDLMQCAFIAVERAARAFRADEGSFAAVMRLYLKNEIAALLGVRGRVRREHYEAVPISMPLGEDGDMTIGDTLEDTDLPDEDESILRADVQREVHIAIDRLQHPHREVVRRYHLDGATLAGLAAEMNISPERVRQIRTKGERALRQDRGLCELASEAICYRRKGLQSFRRDHVSATEAAVMQRERLLTKR